MYWPTFDLYRFFPKCWHKAWHLTQLEFCLLDFFYHGRHQEYSQIALLACDITWRSNESHVVLCVNTKNKLRVMNITLKIDK